MSNASKSNHLYSTSLGGVNSLKSLFVTEGENLVIIFILIFLYNRLVVQNFVKIYGKRCDELILERRVY